MTEPILPQDKHDKIESAILAHFAAGKELLELDELASLAESIGCTQEEVTAVIMPMSFGATPKLKTEFYRLENGQRIPVASRRSIRLDTPFRLRIQRSG